MSVFIGSTTPSQRACLSKEFKKLYAKKTFIPRKQKIAIALNTCDVGIKGLSNHFYTNVLNEIETHKKVSYGNELMGWFAVANVNNNLYMISFNKTKYQDKDKDYFYKTKESFAKRVAQLMKTGH